MRRQHGFTLVLYAVAALAVLAVLSGLAWKIRSAGYDSCRVEWAESNAAASAQAEKDRARQDALSRAEATRLEAALAKQRKLSRDLQTVAEAHIRAMPARPVGCPVCAVTPELFWDVNRALAGAEGSTGGSVPGAGGAAVPAGRPDDGVADPEAARSRR